MSAPQKEIKSLKFQCHEGNLRNSKVFSESRIVEYDFKERLISPKKHEIVKKHAHHLCRSTRLSYTLVRTKNLKRKTLRRRRMKKSLIGLARGLVRPRMIRLSWLIWILLCWMSFW
uniref:Uncharacterized protein n=1 Tax=Cucumis melo TaxID=3656 RepID=A0A1S3C297_CUCME